MTARSTYTDASRPEHLADKYRIYMLRFDDGGMVKLHVGRPVSFRTFCETFILQHIELTTQKIGDQNVEMFYTNNIVAIEKIPNSNKPDFEVTAEGILIKI